MTILFSRPHAAFFVSTALLLLLSIFTVTSFSLVETFISNPTADGFQILIIDFDNQSYPVVEVLPQNLENASSKLALASSVISLFVSSACVIFAVLFWPDAKRTYPISPITSFIHALVFNPLLSFPTMIYLQVAHQKSSIFDPNYLSMNETLYDQGKFDLESWACQVSSYPNSFPRGECRNARAGRVADILCCIAAVAAAAVGAWALRGTRDTIRQAEIEKRHRREEWLGDDNMGNEIEVDYVPL